MKFLKTLKLSRRFYRRCKNVGFTERFLVWCGFVI